MLRAKASARILIAGQAPGTRVHQSGMPFTDPSGDRLREWMGVESDTFYDDTRIAIVPMGFCFPGLDVKGGDRPPRKECASAWRKELLAHLEQVEITLLVGSYAQAWHLGAAGKSSLSETVRSFREYAPRFVPMPHPSWRNNAWLRRNPWFAEELLPHLRERISAILKA